MLIWVFYLASHGFNSLIEFFDLLWSRNNETRKVMLDELNKTNNMILKK